MFTKIGKLLVTNIKNSVLYEFSVGLLGLLVELIDQNGSLGEYISAVQEAVHDFKAAFNKNSKHPFTVRIKEKHKERFSLYIALKRQISVALMLLGQPSAVAAAGNLKKEMKECGLWTHKTLSYRDASKLIDQILQKFSEGPFTQWILDASVQTIVESLRTAQREYESLKQERIEDMGSDMTPVQEVARKNLIEAVLSTLDAVDFGARRNNGDCIKLLNDISEMITETNALTRAAQTRNQNSEMDGPADEETESAIEIGPESESKGDIGPEAEENAETEVEDSAEEGPLEGGIAYG